MSRYKLDPIIIAPPNKGFLIQTPTGKTLFDTQPRGIVRELNRLNDRIKRLESVENSHAAVLNAIDNWIRQDKAKEAKP